MTALEIVNERLAVYAVVQARRDPFGPDDRNGHDATGDINHGAGDRQRRASSRRIGEVSDYAEYRGKQDGAVVFGVSGPLEFAAQEALRYADQYAVDGPVTVERKRGFRWKVMARVGRFVTALPR